MIIMIIVVMITNDNTSNNTNNTNTNTNANNTNNNDNNDNDSNSNNNNNNNNNKLADVHIHRLPDGVRTNICFAEVPQYTIIMTYLCHNYAIIMVYCGTSAKTPFVLTPFESR